jgi:restriction system protein
MQERTPSQVELPTFRDLMWPTLQAMQVLGGSGSIQEIVEKVTEISGFSDEQLSVLHGKGPGTEIEYRLGWARTYLKQAGALNNSGRGSGRGIWSLTDKGRAMTPADIDAVVRQVRSRHPAQRRRAQPGAPYLPTDESLDDSLEGGSEQTWKEQLLNALLDMHPQRFERLVQLLLREAGFVSVAVTGRSGDGGIDGIGLCRVSLVSFPVLFQCKRYGGSVGAAAVRDFRGAMAGRGDKGLLITTGTFTPEARREATRDGVPRIDLIDGDALCELLKEYQLGVTSRSIEKVEVQPEFLDKV